MRFDFLLFRGRSCAYERLACQLNYLAKPCLPAQAVVGPSPQLCFCSLRALGPTVSITVFRLQRSAFCRATWLESQTGYSAFSVPPGSETAPVGGTCEGESFAGVPFSPAFLSEIGKTGFSSAPPRPICQRDIE